METPNNVRERILNTAQQLFHQFGFHRVTIDEIVNQLGMSKKTLYNYFSSKDELILAVVESSNAQISASISAVVDNPDLDFFSKLEGIMSTIHSFHQKISGNIIEDLQKYMPKVHQHLFETARPHVQRNFKKMFVEGVEQGIFRDDISPDILLLLQSVLMEHLMTPETLANLSISGHDLHCMIRKIILEGILTDDGRSKHREICPRDEGQCCHAKE